MFECHKKYNLKRVAYIKHSSIKDTQEVIPRLPRSYGWVEVDLSIEDYYNDYVEYLKLHGYKLIDSATKKIPTFGTRILLIIEKILLFIKGE